MKAIAVLLFLLAVICLVAWLRNCALRDPFDIDLKE